MFNINKNKNTVTKQVKGKEDLAPALVVQVKQVSPKKYEISIVHPNTKEPLYCKVHIAQSIEEAFKLGKEIKSSKFSDVKTHYEEILHIPRPRRGKMKLNTKEDSDKKN